MIGQSGIAVSKVTRADAASVAELSKYGVATVHEAMGRVGLLASYMRPIYPGAKACGTALTIFAHPGDNWMLHVAAELLRDGDVAVLGTSSENSDGMFGELLATSFRARRHWTRDRRRLPGHRRTSRDGFSSLGEGDSRQRHRESDCRFGEHARHLCGNAGASR